MPFDVLGTLGDVQLVKKDGSTVPAKQALEGKVVGFLFSAHWCPPCRKLTPAVKKFYESLRTSGHNEFEVVFVSADRTEPDMMEYMEIHGDWFAIPFGDPLIKNLTDRFRVMGLPCFAIVNQKNIIAAKKNAKNDVQEKKKGNRQMLSEWKKAVEDCAE
ncbi:unnamed protein product, partial [Mesorhabditis belari]|uniref:Thioredoxin domain-containing protein n=1 Tax=Mesorhabditis belari TaxID=2138241 RepID=A0AAF3EN45_9BILA